MPVHYGLVTRDGSGSTTAAVTKGQTLTIHIQMLQIRVRGKFLIWKTFIDKICPFCTGQLSSSGCAELIVCRGDGTEWIWSRFPCQLRADSRILKLFKVGATDGMTTTFVSTFHINNGVIGKYFGVKIISTFAPLKGWFKYYCYQINQQSIFILLSYDWASKSYIL